MLKKLMVLASIMFVSSFSFAINSFADVRRVDISTTSSIGGNYLIIAGIVIAVAVITSFVILFFVKKAGKEA